MAIPSVYEFITATINDVVQIINRVTLFLETN